MTKRYSVDDVAQMLQTDRERIRQAVSDLTAKQVLSAETFLFAESTWRIAPSDVPSIQQFIRENAVTIALEGEKTSARRRKVVRKVNETL